DVDADVVRARRAAAEEDQVAGNRAGDAVGLADLAVGGVGAEDVAAVCQGVDPAHEAGAVHRDLAVVAQGVVLGRGPARRVAAGGAAVGRGRPGARAVAAGPAVGHLAAAPALLGVAG